MGFLSRWFGGGRPADAPATPEPAGPPPAFPHPLVAVPASEALATWRHLRETWRAEGACPVLLGNREEVEGAAEKIAYDHEPPDRILAAAADQTAERFFEARARENRAIFERDDRDPDHRPELVDGIYVDRGAWPGISPPHVLCGHADLLTHRPKPLVYLARIPTVRPWEIPAYLSYGGWNECPDAADQVAVHRHWHDRHGAEIYAVVGDVVECWVPQPPRERGAAEALAREQYLYCADIVEQGTNTLVNLASALLDADAWFFWWD